MPQQLADGRIELRIVAARALALASRAIYKLSRPH